MKLKQLITRISKAFYTRLVTKRFFIVFYICTTDKGAPLIGQTQFMCENTYLNCDEARKQITETLIKHNVYSVVITNIIELSKKDYKDWVS